MGAMTGTAGQDRFGVVESAAGGDEVAFGRIVAAHHDDMRRVCVFITRDGALADDAVQAASQMPRGWPHLPGDTRTEWESGTGYTEDAGAYEGMSAVFTLEPRNRDDCYCWTSKGISAESERCTWDIEGLILEGESPMPLVPE